MNEYPDSTKEALITEVRRLQVKCDFMSGLYENCLVELNLLKASQNNPKAHPAYQNRERNELAHMQESFRETSEYLENLFRFGNSPIIV